MSSFQVKIVGDFCNKRCTYCRNRDFSQNIATIMSSKKLEELFKLLKASLQNKVRVNWHGGEPLLAGKTFFNHIIRLEKECPDKLWLNAVQTNATLIDREWAEFFHNNKFNIGVSVDGSEKTHDVNRIDASGRGTYKRVIRGVNILRDYGIYPSVICTVTKKTKKDAKEMFLGLVEAGFNNIAFNAFYNTASEHSSDVYGLTDGEWLSFLVEIFEAWIDLNNPAVHVREVDSALAWIKSKSANCCMYKGTCSQWLVIDYDGEIYPCERLGKEIHLGNIQSLKTLKDIVSSPVFFEWEKSINILPVKCQGCDFLSLCHNGCVSHRQVVKGEEFPLYTYCESRLGFDKYIRSRLGLLKSEVLDHEKP